MREILKSRHYILKFLRRQGFIYREGAHWTTRHRNWIRHVLMPGNLSEEDRVVLRRRPAVGPALVKRQAGQDPAVIGHAWKCQHRLSKLYHRLAEKKPKQVAATAVVREMVGFLWAVLHDLDPAYLQHSEVTRAA